MSADPARLEVYFHDVGQGDCTIIVPPHGEGDPILFDCADSYVAERFFANHGMTRLEAVVVSHLDLDHMGGILPFLKQHFAQGGEVGKLVLAKEREELSAKATDLVEAARGCGAARRRRRAPRLLGASRRREAAGQHGPRAAPWR